MTLCWLIMGQPDSRIGTISKLMGDSISAVKVIPSVDGLVGPQEVVFEFFHALERLVQRLLDFECTDGPRTAGRLSRTEAN